MSKAELKTPQASHWWAVEIAQRWTCEVHLSLRKLWSGLCLYLRMRPQIDIVFWHKALFVVELSSVPVWVILHVGDLGENTHRDEIWPIVMLTQAINWVKGRARSVHSIYLFLQAACLLSATLIFILSVSWGPQVTQIPTSTGLLPSSKCHVKSSVITHTIASKSNAAWNTLTQILYFL